MNTIFTLSLTGSCMVAGYYVLSFVMGKSFSHRMRYLWLKLALVGYLLPLLWLKRQYVLFLQKIFDVQLIETQNYVNYNQGKHLIIDEAGNFYISAGLYKEILIAILCFGIAFIILFVMLKKMGESYKLLAQNSEAYFSKGVKIHLVEQDYCGSGGIFAPFVIMKKDMGETEETYILKHELMHIKRKDTFFKALLWLAVCIHWFNPIVHLLRRQMERECELSCDDRVLARCSQDERAEYANFLVMHALKKKESPLMTAWNNEEIPIKERINNIMSNRRKSRGKSIMCAALMVVMLFGSSFTVLAYDTVCVIEGSHVAVSESFVEGGEFWLIEEGDEDPFFSKFTNPDILYDQQFIDEKGNIYELTGEMQAYADCEHQYTNAEVVRHFPYSDGSCKVILYSAQHCKGCGIVKIERVISETYYPKCIH